MHRGQARGPVALQVPMDGCDTKRVRPGRCSMLALLAHAFARLYDPARCARSRSRCITRPRSGIRKSVDAKTARGPRCAGRPPTRGAPEAAGSGYGRGGRKTKKGGWRWRGLGWRAFAGLWFRCASTTGRAGLTTSPCWTRREHLRASAATAPLLLPVGDGGGSSEVAFAESGVSHVR